MASNDLESKIFKLNKMMTLLALIVARYPSRASDFFYSWALFIWIKVFPVYFYLNLQSEPFVNTICVEYASVIGRQVFNGSSEVACSSFMSESPGSLTLCYFGSVRRRFHLFFGSHLCVSVVLGSWCSNSGKLDFYHRTETANIRSDAVFSSESLSKWHTAVQMSRNNQLLV